MGFVNEIHQKLEKNNESLAVAESCTGGLLAGEITTQAGISTVFYGAVVSYSNEVKTKSLGVSIDSLEKFGAVSSQVALEMAKGVKNKMNASWGLSTTGVAGPAGGSIEKPVGTVWFGISGPKVEKTEMKIFEGNRQEVRTSAVDFALKLLNSYL